MAAKEKIRVHLLSVWGEERKLFKRGREGMLFLTDNNLMFVTKTEAKMKWWQAAVQRQTMFMLKEPDVMITQDGYCEAQLEEDLENEKNMVIPFGNIVETYQENNDWATAVVVRFQSSNGVKKYRFSIVQDWTRYPLKDPMKFITVDWNPFIEFIKKHQEQQLT